MFRYYTVYKITNLINHKIYFGKHETNNLDDNYMGSGTMLEQAKIKYGVDNFKKEILYVFQSEEEMYAKEQELVTEEFRLREDNYNIKTGGFNGKPSVLSIENGVKTRKQNGQAWHSEETKNKIAKARLGQPSARKGATLPEEHRIKLSKPKSEQGKQNIKESNLRLRKNKPVPEETRRKISETLKNRYRSRQ